LPIALTGVGKDLTEEMGDEFVHDFARGLYQPTTDYISKRSRKKPEAWNCQL
jgi:hypothetical protein